MGVENNQAALAPMPGQVSALALRNRLKPLQHVPAQQLLVHEIFASIQGESSFAGLPCTFVRTTACNLRCRYCDTRHAFTQGKAMSLPSIMSQVQQCGLPLVEVTGGEPLLQPLIHVLLRQLCEAGYTVLLETSGSIAWDSVDARVHRIVDLKTPSSGEVAANLYDQLATLRQRDEVKFVIGDQQDYVWAKDIIQKYNLNHQTQVLMGCVFDALAPALLSRWILADCLPVRLQLQLHKYIWDPQRTGV